MNEAERIFDAVGKAASIVQAHHAVAEKREQIAGVTEKRCGNCDHWMKSSCRPEKVEKQFKSCNSFACKDFEWCHFSQMQAEKWGKELAELEATLQERKQGR